MSTKEKNTTIHFKSSEKTKSLELIAYLFDRNKKLVEKVIIKDDKAKFKTKFDRRDNSSILVLPNDEAISNETDFAVLASKHKAYRPKVRINRNNELEALAIPDKLTAFWFRKKCRVLGNVSKVFNINNFKDRKGLCNVRVHICEVDRIEWLLPKVPDDIIIKIPDLILYPEIPMPIPTIKEIPEIPRPFPLPNLNFDFNFFEGTKRPELNLKFPKENKLILSKATQPIIENEKVLNLLQSKNPKLIREAILNNFSLFHPVICLVPWLWHYFYKCDHLTTVYTDNNGDFDTEISYAIFGDHPDLYFWVEAFIDDQWVTVYKPWLSCNTYWNYKCGTEVNINVTDERVRWECSNDLDGELIWIKTINWGTSVTHIEQRDVDGVPIQGKILKRQGLTDKHETKGNFRRPFGKNLSFIVQFSKDLPSNKYIYYRWSFKKVKNADLSDVVSTYKSLDNLVRKSYSYTFRDSNGHLHFNYNSVKLGPFDVASERNLYLIPTSSPQDAPFNASEQDADWDRNTRTIAFDSSLEGDGLYEFILELFDKNGNKVTNIPNQLFQVPDFDTFTPSINAPAINLVNNIGTNTCSAFKMVMRIDNSSTQADIYKIKVDGVEVNPTCCGFVPYENVNSNIEIKFRAYHPHNFADLSFVVQKGTCSDSVQTRKTNARGMVIGNAITTTSPNYIRNEFSEYTKTFKPADLLGICASEEKAAFAQRLYVNALATNGDHEIDAYDSSKLVAFALDKKKS
ncbi:hypothetical protein ACSIGC_14995 [Tenacibaculum sp. ZS6-P6]|uniref:hypothetical protein n=1 Tax=Tenacibaculum sp. ZS6-P6 TaxID=3447503 RepID=UPI003F98C542